MPTGYEKGRGAPGRAGSRRDGVNPGDRELGGHHLPCLPAARWRLTRQLPHKCASLRVVLRPAGVRGRKLRSVRQRRAS